MKGSHGIFKEGSTLDRKTSLSRTHSNIDLSETPIKPKMSKGPMLPMPKIKKHSNRTAATKHTQPPQEAVYKCGCAGHSLGTQPAKVIPTNGSIRIPLKNKLFHCKDNLKLSISARIVGVQKQTTSKSKISLGKLLKRVDTLHDAYEELVQEKNRECNEDFSEVKYVPQQVIRSVDKVRKMERPIEHKVIKVKKIPRQIIKYREVDVQVPVRKEYLVFVDPQQPEFSYPPAKVAEQHVREVGYNADNQRLKSSLNELRGKIHILERDLGSSNEQIYMLQQSIQSELKRCKSLDTIVSLEEPVLRLGDKNSPIADSIATTTVCQSQCFETELERSRSQPVIRVKSRMYINGKQLGKMSGSLVTAKKSQAPMFRSEPELRQCSMVIRWQCRLMRGNTAAGSVGRCAGVWRRCVECIGCDVYIEVGEQFHDRIDISDILRGMIVQSMRRH